MKYLNRGQSLLQFMFIALLFIPQVLIFADIARSIPDDEAAFARLDEESDAIQIVQGYIQKLLPNPVANVAELSAAADEKGEHVDEIKAVMTDYFMIREIKLPEVSSGPEYQIYSQELSLIHEILILLHEAREKSDLDHARLIQTKINEFKNVYYQAKESERNSQFPQNEFAEEENEPPTTMPAHSQSNSSVSPPAPAQPPR